MTPQLDTPQLPLTPRLFRPREKAICHPIE
jgi:hypothetical protein